MLDFFSIRRESSIEKEEGFNSVRREEAAKQSGRTNFNEMVQYLQEHQQVCIILCEKTDRLYRNFKDYVTMIEDLIHAEVSVISTGQERDDSILIEEKLNSLMDLDKIKAEL